MRIQSEAAILSVLKTVPLFQQLDSSALEALAAVASMSELSDGDVLFEEGAAADEVIFVMMKLIWQRLL